MPQGSLIGLRSQKQRTNTMDSHYIRLVGPSLVMPTLKGTGAASGDEFSPTEYLYQYTIREPGIYTLQVQ